MYISLKRSETVGYGWIRLDTVGYGWIRLDTVGYGSIRLDTVVYGYERIRSDTVRLWYGYGSWQESEELLYNYKVTLFPNVKSCT
jgi:hypothetical protein